MNMYRLWVWVAAHQTAFTVVYAANVHEAKLLGQAQYGDGNVIDCMLIS